MTARAETLRRADAEARSLAQREYTLPLVLEAGAGTGKTATLVARVVVWCLGRGWEQAEAELSARPSGERSPERIAARVLRGVVAITFTEAAAAEMATRVELALAGVEGGEVVVGLDEDALPQAECRGQRAAWLRDALDHLPVQTIHAYAKRLLAAHPFEAGLHPSLEVDAEGRVQREIVHEVVEELLQDAYEGDGPAFTLAAAGFGPAELEAELSALIDAGVCASDLAEELLAPGAIRGVLARLRAGLEAFAVDAAPLSEATKAKKALATLDVLAELTAALPAPECGDVDALLAFLSRAEASGLAGVLDRVKDWARARFGVEEQQLLGATAERLSALCTTLAPLLAHVLALDPVRLDEGRRVLGPCLTRVEARLRRRGVATFASLLGDAAGLLASRPDVAARVRRGIDQLLVDEFQDTDPRQCAVVGALALEGETRPGLFLVGDPKQSIYGWRDADLQAYEDFVARVCDAGGSLHRLSVNYRSLPAVLDEVERVIEPVMQRERGVQPAFEPLVPCPQHEGRVWDASERFAGVEQWVVTDLEPETGAPAAASATEAARREARALAEDLCALHARGDVAWKDVGVLFRSRGDWDVYLGALREAGVPFAVEGDRTYYRRREIIEAAAWVRCVLDPADTLALVTALRSAVVGVPDAAWLPLRACGFFDRVAALERPDAAVLAALGKEIDTVAASLPADVPGLSRVRGWGVSLQVGLALLASLREAFEREPADRFVEQLRTSLLFEATEAARFLGAWRVANLDRFFRDLSETLSSGTPVPSVLRRLREAVAEEEPQGEQPPPDAASDAVRILTLHGAKGLDFGHVYLMQLHKGSGRPPGPSVDAARGESGGLEFRLLGVPTLGFDRVEARREQVASAELVRLLYVGMTRARERLVVSGVWPAYHSRGRGASQATLLASRSGAPDLVALADELVRAGESSRELPGARFVFPALRTEASQPIDPARGDTGATTAEVSVRDAQRWTRRVSEARARMALPMGGRASDLAHPDDTQTEGVPPSAEARRDGEIARLAGIGVHAVLEHLDLEADAEAALGDAAERLPDHLRPHARGAAFDAALAEARSMLASLAGGAVLARLEAVRARVAGREVPVLLPPGSEDAAVGFMAGTIDLLFEDPADGALVVVDYKTDAVANEAALEARVRRYAPQLQLYARAVAEALTPGRPPRCELWFLAVDRCVSLAATPVEEPDQLSLLLPPQA